MVRMITRSLDAVRAIPGVTGAAVTDSVPFDTSSRFTVVLPEGVPRSEQLPSPRMMVVTPGYFETMGITLIRGRYLEGSDREGALRAAVLEERLARRFWPDRDPIGQTFYIPFGPAEMEIQGDPDHRL